MPQGCSRICGDLVANSISRHVLLAWRPLRTRDGNADICGRDPASAVSAPHLRGRTPEEARDSMELAQQVVSLPHGTKRDLLALVKKTVTWSVPQTERRRKRKRAKKDVFRRLALR
jgi:hypothetical protein